jgi:hypothetical protein
MISLAFNSHSSSDLRQYTVFGGIYQLHNKKTPFYRKGYKGKLAFFWGKQVKKP